MDILPVEAPPDVLARYHGAAFLGWNTFDARDFASLLGFVEGGATLLLARPHLSTEVRRQQPARLPAAPLLGALLGRNWRNVRGRKEHVVGRGKVIYYGADLYPGAAPVRPAYARDLAALGLQAREVERERGWIEGGADVAFTAYDWPDGQTRTLYLLNTDWWSGRRTHTTHLLLGALRFTIAVRFGVIETLVVRAGVAAMPDTPDAEVMGIEVADGAASINLQSDRGTRLSVFSARSPRPVHLAAPAGGHVTLRCAI